MTHFYLRSVHFDVWMLCYSDPLSLAAAPATRPPPPAAPPPAPVGGAGGQAAGGRDGAVRVQGGLRPHRRAGHQVHRAGALVTLCPIL